MTLRLNRRGFLRASGLAGCLTLAAPASILRASPPGVPEKESVRLGLFVQIRPDNSVLIRTATTEIGQGTETAVPMLIAEELDVDWNLVEVGTLSAKLKSTDAGPLPAGVFAQGAGGSNAIRASWLPSRQVGAAARNLLMQEAAARWDVPLAELTTELGQVLHSASGRQANYGDLARGAASRPLPDHALPLKSPAAFRIIGTPQKQKKALSIVTGQRMFGIDQTLDGMLHAVMVRPLRIGSQIVSVDDSDVRAIAGVRHVVHIAEPGGPDGIFEHRPIGAAVAIVADSHWIALKGRDALKVEWSDPPIKEDSDEMVASAAAKLFADEGLLVSQEGDPAGAFARAAKIVEARYDAPMVAHATLEPQNTIAHVTADRCLVITPTQQPSLCARTAAALTGLPLEQIEISVVRSGGGFGRRLTSDQVAEAILIAREIGVPVKLLWTRECDMTTDFYRNGGVHRLRAALDDSGNIIGWMHGVATQSRRYRRAKDQSIASLAEREVPIDDAPGVLVPNRSYHFAPIFSAAARGSWRAPGANIFGWVEQAFIDEVAYAAGEDPLAHRLALLKAGGAFGKGRDRYSIERLVGVLQRVADKANWTGPGPGNGRGRGIAAHFSFGSYAAHIVDVTMGDGGTFTVNRVVTALDCGIVVNPNGVAMQNEGSINDALSTAIGLEISIKDGVIQQRNFDTYEVMRMDRAATRIETHIVASTAPPSGMGEPPFPPFAPALTNALFAATGRRIRRLPISQQLA